MLKVLRYFVLLLACCIYKTQSGDSYLKAAYYDIKPYIFNNSKGELDGIYPMIMEQTIIHCLNETHNRSRVVDFKSLKFNSREEFRVKLDNLSQSNQTKQYEDYIWFPLTFYNITEQLTKNHKKEFRIYNIINVKNLAVIVARDRISLITKVAAGLQTCSLIFFITFQMAVFFGILLWLLERNSEGGFPKSYIKGITAGLWWSFSIGFNDTVPKTTIGRLMAAIWVAMIVMVTSIMTASITNSVTGGLSFSINGHKVAFLEDSWELHMVQRDYSVTPIQAKSYEDVINLVRKRKAFAAVMDENVAAWYKDTILDDKQANPLRIVEKLPVNVFIDDLAPKKISSELESIFDCMLKNKIDVYERSISTYYRFLPVENLYLDSIMYLVKNNKFVQGLLATVCAFLLIGLILALYTRHKLIRQNMREAVEAITKSDEKNEGPAELMESIVLKNQPTNV